METGRCSGWFYLWIVVLPTALEADSTSPPTYILHPLESPFDHAEQKCSPGVLTSLRNEQEVSQVLKQVSKQVSIPGTPLSEFTIWVGLKKPKVCVDRNHPLRGFKWLEDGSEESQGVHWANEPRSTCTSVLCAALKGEFDGLTVIRWSLMEVSCKTSHRFICKHTGRTNTKSTTTKPESEATTAKPTKHGTEKLELLAAESELLTQADTELKSTSGPSLVRPSSSVLTLGSDSCQQPVIPGSRSLSLDPYNSSRIQVECWSNYQLELHCGGHPAAWHLPDDTPANLTIICQLCAAGSQKDAHGKCVVVNTCSGAPCTHTCVKTHDDEVCVDSVTGEDGGWLWGILIPVLVALAVLVLLVVLVVVVVKCCLKKRSKKQAMKKAEKMAMKKKNGRDSLTTAT